MSLARDLENLDPSFLAHLALFGFDAAQLLGWAATLTGDPTTRRTTRNRVAGPCTAPKEDEILRLPERGTSRFAECEERGRLALSRGELGFVVMAGGMATRMGSIVKALVEPIPGHTFLDLRLQENRRLTQDFGCPPPLFLMTSDATDSAINDALRHRGVPGNVRTFRQGLSLRLTPDGNLFRTEANLPSAYATGHGDLVDAMKRQSLISQFLSQGGRVLWMTNLDNLGATIDPVLLGHFLERNESVMVEVCEKAPNDRGGIPVHANGRLQVLEEFRLPQGFEATSVRVFNTNTFLCRADALETAKVHWTHFEVEKYVGGKPAIQFERLLQELTSALPSAFLRVPREGLESRFLPVKDYAELELRSHAIREVCRARGLLPV